MKLFRTRQNEAYIRATGNNQEQAGNALAVLLHFRGMVSGFEIVVKSSTGEHTATVTLERVHLLPAFDIDFGNGFKYLLVYYNRKWAAVTGEGYAPQTPLLTMYLARKIAYWGRDHRLRYRAMITTVDGATNYHYPFPAAPDPGKFYNPELSPPIVATELAGFLRC